MKNVLYPFMTLVAAAAALVSCQREEMEVKDNTEYVYRFEIVESETKATLDQDGVWWEVGDDVGIVVNNTNINAHVVENNGRKEIQFTSATAIAENTPVYAYYPYSSAVTAATQAQIVIPSEQEGGSVSAMPMAGIPVNLVAEAGATSNGRIRFLNLGAVIDFRVYSTKADYRNETVESVTFMSGPDAAKASGTATIDLTGVQDGETPSAPEMTMGNVSYHRAKVTQSVPVAADKNSATTPMYLIVAPDEFTSGTITVVTNAASYTFTFTEPKTLVRNTVKKYAMNLGSSNVEREAFTKTYEYQTSLTDGETYLIGGSETAGLYIALFPPVKYSNDTNDKCEHFLYSTNNSIATITTDDAAVINSEVVMEQADSKWLVKVKNTGLYMYSSKNYEILFTDDASIAGHTYSYKVNNRYDVIKTGEMEFYHSGSIDSNAGGFTYYKNKGANNLRFYKQSGSSKSQTLSFLGVPEGGFTWDIGEGTGTYTQPELEGAKTTVVYSSSNMAIANVDATTGEVSFGSVTGTVIITATAAGMDGYATAEASYKIVVSDSSIPPVTYYKASILEAGYDYIIVSNGQALKNNGNGNVVSASPVTVKANNTIDLYEDETEGILWRATEVTSDYGTHTLVNNSIFLYRNGYQEPITLTGNTASTGNYIPWRYDGEHLWNGSGSPYYAYYDDGWKISKTDVPSVTTALFTARQPRAISFDPVAVEYDLADPTSFVKPTLNGADGATVTYVSSDESVATVASDGTLTVLKKTIAPITITASIAPSSDYQGASASYELTVVNSSEVPSIYLKVTSVEDLEIDAKYLIVFEGLAGDADDGDPKVFDPVLIANDSQFDKNATSALDVLISDSTISSADFGDCQFTLEEGYSLKSDKVDKYIYPWYSGSSSYLYAESPASHALTIAINDGIAEIKYTSGSNSRNIVWSTSNHYFSSNSDVSGQYSTGICLYKLYDSRQAQGMAFSGATAKFDLYENEWSIEVPSLSGNKTTPVQYSSSNPAVATVDEGTGEVTPLAVGTTIITATAPDNETYKKGRASYTLEIIDTTPLPQTLSFSPDAVTFNIYDKTLPVQMPSDATTLSGAHTTVSWESSDENVATVNSDGVVTIVATAQAGNTVIITATAAAGTVGDVTYAEGSASYTITVTSVQKIYYQKVTELEDGGTYLIVNMNLSSPVAFKPVLNSGKTGFNTTGNTQSVTVVDDKIESTTEIDACQVVIEEGKYMMAGDYYFYPASNAITARTSKPSTTITFSFSDGIATIRASNNYYLRYSSNAFSTSSRTSTNFTFFKLDDGQPKKQNLVFSPAEVTYNMYGSPAYNAPTLSGAKTEVTYSSDNDAVAEIADPTTGALTIKGVGVAHITATAAASDEYLLGSASYTLTVKNTPPSTYIKVNEITSGGTYLIVSTDANNYNGLGKMRAFAGDEAGSVVEVDGTSGTITGDYSSCEFIITESGSNYTLLGPEGYVTGNSDNAYSRYIQVSESEVTMSLGSASEFSGEGLVSDAFYFYYLKGSSKEVLYLNSDKKFKIGGSGRKYGVYLYKKD